VAGVPGAPGWWQQRRNWKQEMKNTVVASGRIVIDDFHERLFLFVVASTGLRLNGEMVLVS
jgi:hypothetical protein